MKNLQYIFLIVIIGIIVHSCKHDDTILPIDTKGYPDTIAQIILTKCAITGCHTDISKDAASGLSLATWDKMYEGSRNNSSVVPFRSNQSFMMFFINTYADLGQSISPAMPLNAPILTKKEVLTIRNWIDNGAVNSNGDLKFPETPNRKKVYIINQGCDLVTVLDYKTNLIMKYFDIGNQPNTESPHTTKISADGQFFYVCFYAGNIFQKYSTVDETLVAEVNLGSGSWNTFAMNSNSTRAYVVNWEANGSIAVVDLENMTLLNTYQGSGLLVWPHGSVMTDDNTLYITAQTGNFIYKIDVTDVNNPDISQVSLQTGEAPSTAPSYDAHDIHINPSHTEYAVTCQGTNELRFFNVQNDSLLAVVSTGIFPQEIEFSHSSDYCFVSCMEDNISFPSKTGAISVVNYKTHTFVKNIYSGFQPHGIEVDDARLQVYVANRNSNPNGPAPHHTTDCGGRNGYLTIIDINTLELVPGFRAELSVDPYYISIK